MGINYFLTLNPTNIDASLGSSSKLKYSLRYKSANGSGLLDTTSHVSSNSSTSINWTGGKTNACFVAVCLMFSCFKSFWSSSLLRGGDGTVSGGCSSHNWTTSQPQTWGLPFECIWACLICLLRTSSLLSNIYEMTVCLLLQIFSKYFEKPTNLQNNSKKVIKHSRKSGRESLIRTRTLLLSPSISVQIIKYNMKKLHRRETR